MGTDAATILSALTPIFCDVFDDDRLTPVREMVAEDVDGWDSLGHIRLIVAVEQHFGIQFSSTDISAWPNVGAFVDAIQSKMR